ncbi:MAG: electron-transfer flavoprotein:ubiquinone oxidoreductase [Terriglobia bacterium]
METEREILEVDVLFVGAGPASLSGAIHLRHLIEQHNRTVATAGARVEASIAVIEKGREIGAHNLSGAILDPKALRELFPDDHEASTPLTLPVAQDDLYYLTESGKIRIPPLLPSLRNEGNFLISLNRFVQWLGEKAGALGIDLFPGFAGTELIFQEDRLVGIRTGDKGVDREGRPKGTYEPGVDIQAKVVILGEGVRGSLTKQLAERLNLDQGKNPQQYALGIKEVWELPEPSMQNGRVIHTLGYPLRHENYGGGFVYHLGSQLSIGLVIGLDYWDPALDPHLLFQEFKSHPFISSLLKGAQLIHYGAKAIPEGGYYSIPKCVVNGGLIIGDSAGFLNSQRLKGIHLAMKSGMLAAETVLEGLLRTDFTEVLLNGYVKRLKASWVESELYPVRNFHQGFHHGLFPGILQAGLQTVTGGRGWKDPLPARAAHELMRKSPVPMGALPAPSQSASGHGEFSRDKLTDVHYSGIQHEEDQPNHLRITNFDICHGPCVTEYQNPCVRFCPAQVYEMREAEDGREDSFS